MAMNRQRKGRKMKFEDRCYQIIMRTKGPAEAIAEIKRLILSDLIGEVEKREGPRFRSPSMHSPNNYSTKDRFENFNMGYDQGIKDVLDELRQKLES